MADSASRQPADRRPGKRRRRGGVRLRTTLVATLIVTGALLAGAAGLVWELHRSQVNNVASAARLRAQDVAALVRSASLPAVLPSSADDVTVVQIVDDQGHIVLSTENLEGEQRMATFVPTTDQPVTRTVGGLPVGDGHSFLVAAVRVTSPQGVRIVYSAASLALVDSTMHSAIAALAVGTPALLVLVTVTTWLLVGRALRPVEEIRATAAEISTRDLDRRVPEPASADEISRLAQTMNDMLDRLQAGADQQRRFTADASHELRSPLASLRSQLEVARAHPERADWLLTSDESLAEIDRMERLVRDLLLLARADAGGLKIGTDRVDMAQLARSEADKVRGRGRVQVDDRGIVEGVVTGNADWLKGVLRNLLDNAERHAQSTVTIDVSRRNQTVEVTVANDGPSIPAPARDHVFDRFTRLDESRNRDEGGSGLGLAITRDVLAAHHGTIEVADCPQGACFVARLPAASAGDRG
jgi:signal transduction histidine kinase